MVKEKKTFDVFKLFKARIKPKRASKKDRSNYRPSWMYRNE